MSLLLLFGGPLDLPDAPPVGPPWSWGKGGIRGYEGATAVEEPAGGIVLSIKAVSEGVTGVE